MRTFEQPQEQRTVRDRTVRLRARLGKAERTDRDYAPVIKGILDLLNDELGEAQDQDPV